MGVGFFLVNRIFAQSSGEVCSLLNQEHCKEDQKVFRSGIPRPPNLLGVKIMRLENWFLLPLMNLVKIFSTSVMISLCGSGRAVARWVNLERRQVLMMFTFALVVRRMMDHWKISSRTALMALVQFTSRCSKSPVRVIPSSLKGDGSIEKPVEGVI